MSVFESSIVDRWFGGSLSPGQSELNRDLTVSTLTEGLQYSFPVSLGVITRSSLRLKGPRPRSLDTGGNLYPLSGFLKTFGCR